MMTQRRQTMRSDITTTTTTTTDTARSKRDGPWWKARGWQRQDRSTQRASMRKRAPSAHHGDVPSCATHARVQLQASTENEQRPWRRYQPPPPHCPRRQTTPPDQQQQLLVWYHLCAVSVLCIFFFFPSLLLTFRLFKISHTKQTRVGVHFCWCPWSSTLHACRCVSYYVAGFPTVVVSHYPITNRHSFSYLPLVSAQTKPWKRKKKTTKILDSIAVSSF